MLTQWFTQYKVTSSFPYDEPGGGRPDPFNQKNLFTRDAKNTVDKQKINADIIQNGMPLEQIYRSIPPTKATRHGLSEHISLRCESKLEGFHDVLANFANSGMRTLLCDNLNLIGTAQYNVKIRHQLQMVNRKVDDKIRITSYWANQPEIYNHSELMYIQGLAKEAGLAKLPFEWIRPLPQDNGERFFGLYWVQEVKRRKAYKDSGLHDRCCCPQCGTNAIEIEYRTALVHKNKTATVKNVEAVTMDATAYFRQTNTAGKSVKRFALDALNIPPARRVKSKLEVPIAPKVVAMGVIPQQHVNMYPNGYFGSFQNGLMAQQFFTPPQFQFGYPHQYHHMHYTGQEQVALASLTRVLNPPGETHNVYNNHLSQLVEANVKKTVRQKAQQVVCCEPFLRWAENDNRNGRPPHSKDCYKRKKV
jgi:hypothetical protein